MNSFLVVLFETRFPYVTKIGLKLEILLLSFLSAKATGVHYCGWRPVFYSCFSCVCIHVRGCAPSCGGQESIWLSFSSCPPCFVFVFRLIYYYFICMCDCLNVCMCTMHMPAAGRGQKMVSNPPEQAVEKDLMGAGN